MRTVMYVVCLVFCCFLIRCGTDESQVQDAGVDAQDQGLCTCKPAPLPICPNPDPKTREVVGFCLWYLPPISNTEKQNFKAMSTCRDASAKLCNDTEINIYQTLTSTGQIVQYSCCMP